MTDQQVQAQLWEMQRKIADLESKLTTVLNIVQNIDVNTVSTANKIDKLVKR